MQSKSSCSSKYCECNIYSMDSATPLKVHLSAYYKRSFAFYTVKERMPVILTKLLDHLVRDKEKIIEKYGQVAKEELKAVIGEMSKLKYEIQTNKPITDLDSAEPDVAIYNRYLREQSESEGTIRYFTAIWLHAECYMYRRIRNFFENTTSLKELDPFEKQKQEAFTQSTDAIIAISEYLLTVVKKSETLDIKEEFFKLLKLNLWGNKCDLSISVGADNSQINNPLSLLEKYENYILSNHSEQIWNALNENNTEESSEFKVIDFVNDNAGYEMITDFCLADFLISHKFTDKVVFNIKSIPWFISDTTCKDLRWIIRTLISHPNPTLKKMGIRWNKYIRDNVWSYKSDDFWTLPFDFTHMKAQNNELYSRLSESKMIIFKGDLNYRKLFGEINWEPSTPVVDALQGFQLTKLCVLRTIKADIVCGLEKGLADDMYKKDPEWMITGNYGVIQYAE